MPSGWVGLPQARRILVSERVAPRLVWPGVVVTLFVTGFPAPGKVRGSHSVLLKPAFSGKKSLRWLGRGGAAKAANMAGTIPSAVSCRGPITRGLGRRRTVETATCPRRRLVRRCAVPASSRVAVSAGRCGYSCSLRRRRRIPRKAGIRLRTEPGPPARPRSGPPLVVARSPCCTSRAIQVTRASRGAARKRLH